MSEFWRGFKYVDQTPVPLKQHRCRSEFAGHSKGHVCKMHHAHVGLHKCICGKRWNEAGVAA